MGEVVLHPINKKPAFPVDVHARAAAILQAANTLLRDGYTILDFQADALSAKPCIWLHAEPRLAGLVDSDVASYYMGGYDKHGPYRIGQFDRLGVAVKWIERDIRRH